MPIPCTSVKPSIEDFLATVLSGIQGRDVEGTLFLFAKLTQERQNF